MKSSFLISAIVAVPLLGGCIIVDADDNGYSSNFSGSNGQYATVYAADIANDSVSFTVSDNGCTDRGFFDVEVHKDDIDEFDVGLRRTRQDHCKALNEAGTTVTWTFEELGIPSGAEITISNRVRR